MLPANANDPDVIAAMANDPELADLIRQLRLRLAEYRHTYNYTWLGRPIIQSTEDLIAMQEVIFATKPDLIIETGIAHGGSLVYYASLLELLGGGGRVLGIDIDIRAHNREAIERHSMYRRIQMIEGSAIDNDVAKQVVKIAQGFERVMVVLDSNHTHDHVLAELELYGPLVTVGCYLVVFDTTIAEMPADFFSDRPWGEGDNPRTAVDAHLKCTDRFEIDRDIDAKLLLSSAEGGFLRCVKE